MKEQREIFNMNLDYENRDFVEKLVKLYINEMKKPSFEDFKIVYEWVHDEVGTGVFRHDKITLATEIVKNIRKIKP
jgi:hypothetical protein